MRKDIDEVQSSFCRWRRRTTRPRDLIGKCKIRYVRYILDDISGPFVPKKARFESEHTPHATVQTKTPKSLDCTMFRDRTDSTPAP